MQLKAEASQLKIYNTLTGNKDIFTPINKNHVGMYVCGPTVYSNVHLGNVRTFMSFDMIFRYFKHLGYKVRYVRNITDVGHLTDDADDGEDKIAKKARLEKIEPMEIVQRYTVDFHNVLSTFHFLPPSIEPTATGHIIEQIEIIKSIIDKGLAYEVNGSVYFDVHKFDEDHDYGKLSGRNLEDLVNNSRALDGQSDKKNPQDFALWKKAEPEHIMSWPSPWSDGFPGWHLECTAMSTRYLGEQFDIHGGGMDLKFPHHECEIAQAEAWNGQSPVKYWMHANMLKMNGQKMSKSTGNSINPDELLSGKNDILSKAYNPSVIRFFMMQSSYRSILDLTDDGLLAAEKGYNRLMEAVNSLKNLTTSSESSQNTKETLAILKSKFYEAMNDDFNTPILISWLFEGVTVINKIKSANETISAEDLKEFTALINGFIFDVMGLQNESATSNVGSSKLEGLVEMLINMRKDARENKDFATSDRIRDELLALGIQLKDGKDGTTFTTN